MALELGIGLKAKGFNIDFVTSKWHDGVFKSRLDCAGLSRFALPIGFISATLSFDAMRMTLIQLLNWPRLILRYYLLLKAKTPVRIIHTNWHHLILLMPFLNRRRDIYWVHELAPYKLQYRCFFRILSSRLERFVCVSHAVAASLQRLGVAESQLLVIHNGISISITAPACSPSRTHPECCRIGIVGQIGAWKGHEDLLEALASVYHRSHNIELHIFGKGQEDYIMLIRRKARELSLSHLIVWRGFVNDRNDIYSSIDICVVPSRFEEPFGLAALEPGLFSLPVVASRVGGLPEIIEDGLNGLLFTAGNFDELANALNLLVGDQQLRAKMGASAREIAVERFSSEKFITAFSLLSAT